MRIATDLLKATHIGIRELKGHLTAESLKEPLVITDRGVPVSINLPYSDILELVDILDEMTDSHTEKLVKESRRAVRSGAKGLPVVRLFKKMRAAHR